jgi:hypothetical protein
MADDSSAQAASKRTREIPLGPIKGRLHRLPQYENLGQVRPFGPGEWVQMSSGAMTSEESVTIPYNNRWAVVPGLWLVNGVPTKVNEDQATEYAQQSGLQWPEFDTENLANQFANHREAIWERTPQGRTDMQRALWSRKFPGSR